MQLPALDAEERAYLQSLLPNSALHAFARRLEQRLLVSLGVPASVSASPSDGGQEKASDGEPAIRIAPELAAAWLALRLGGRTGEGALPPKDAMLVAPFKALIRRVLAESAVNAGVADWPQAMRLRLSMGGQQGTVEIVWNSVCSLAWAQRTIRETR